MPQYPALAIDQLPAFGAKHDIVNAVIEAPRGVRNKFKFVPEHRVFTHFSTLPLDLSYPFDFGFIPSTLADDGDPLDVHVLIDEPSFVGAVIPARLIGVIDAEQTQPNGDVVRNDRLIAIAVASSDFAKFHRIDDARDAVHAIERFWTNYNARRNKPFRLLGRGDAARAKALVERSLSTRNNS